MIWFASNAAKKPLKLHLDGSFRHIFDILVCIFEAEMGGYCSQNGVVLGVLCALNYRP
jgi:hypothetical protein